MNLLDNIQKFVAQIRDALVGGIVINSTSPVSTTETNSAAILNQLISGISVTPSSTTSVQGTVAHDAADSGNPVKIGGKAYTAIPSGVSNGDRVDAYFDQYGRLHVINEGGGGVSVPPPTHVSPVDFTATRYSTTEIDITGAPFTVADANCFIIFVAYKPTAGVWTYLINGSNGVSITASANRILVSGAGTPFASGDTYYVGVQYQQKTIDTTIDSQKVVEQSPNWLRYNQQEIANTTNLNGSASYPSTNGMVHNGYKNIAFEFKSTGTGTTYTIKMSMDGTTWYDITKSGYDVVNNTIGNASYVDVNTVVDFDNLNATYVRVDVVGDGSNAIVINTRQTY